MNQEPLQSMMRFLGLAFLQISGAAANPTGK